MTSLKKNFSQDEHVIIRNFGDDKEYRAKVVGKAAKALADFYIVELLDAIHGLDWTHAMIIETCLFREGE